MSILTVSITDTLSAQSQIPATKAVLANDIVRFEFEAEHMGLAAMVDLATGVNHIQAVEGKHTLWELTFYKGNQKRSLSSAQVPCSSYSIKELPDRFRRATFEWFNMDLDEEKQVVSVRITVDLPRNSGIAEWRIWVNNDSNIWGLYEVDFPKCNGYLKSGEYDIAVPRRNWGKLFKNCSQRMSYKYPHGWSMPMQFMCAMKGTSAIYMAAHDPRAWDKSFTIEPGKEFYIRTNVENMAVPGSDHKDPFPVMMGVYRGSWMQGAKTYRKFAITSPWTSEGKISQRSSMPKALKDIGLWMRVGNYIGPKKGTLAEKNKPLIDAQKYFEVPTAAHWYNWHKIPFDTHYPNYFPTKPGISDQVRDLVSKGLVIMPYINGRIIDISNDDFDEYLPYCAKDRMGKHYLETYGNKVKQAPMCCNTEFWQKKVTHIVERLAKEVGVNAVYIDQIAAASPVLCFDKSHGHPLGGGGWWVDGYRKMLKRVQKVAHSNSRDMIITTECAAEPFMDGVDAFLIWIKPDERSIPMITAVYSGYSIYFGSPAWFQHGDRAWIMAQGRAFLWGSQNGWMDLKLFRPEHTKKVAYLKKVGKCRVAARKFLTFGELVGLIEPKNDVKAITETWPDHGNNPRTATLPCIQGSIWKAEDGTLGIFLANYLEKNNTIEFKIDPTMYGTGAASAGYRVTQIQPEGNHIEERAKEGILKRTEKLGPWEIRILEIRAALPKYTPTSDYSSRKIEGWKVLVNNELLSEHVQLADEVLKLLKQQLYQITRVVPAEPLKELRRIPIWTEYKAPRHPCMCYHPNRQWLTDNDFNPEKERSVEIANAKNFLKWTIGQPWMVLHELAHSYHHCVLGYDNTEVNLAYKDAVKSKQYESVLHINGWPRRAYALNNDQEYFAEATEAFFGTNDFYPFVRSELQQHDPNMYRLLKKLWKVE
ncbi:MAG: DUF6259 domain-containing protein [Planctomycetota bacterium]